jgi:hypothetical protein
MKPAPTKKQVEQAAFMRERKKAKADYLQRQHNLFLGS